MNFFKVVMVCMVASVSSGVIDARPRQKRQEADAVTLELVGGEEFNPNPQYTYSYQVADDEEQTYVTLKESRDGPAVTGEYSYVDPFGSLVTVTYSADGENGYSETRSIQENFVSIRRVDIIKAPRPPKVKAPASDVDLVSQIITSLTPFIRETVAGSVGGQVEAAEEPAPAPAVEVLVAEPEVAVAPAPSEVAAKFGSGEGNTFKHSSPSFEFETTLG